MAIRYPNGRKYTPTQAQQKSAANRAADEHAKNKQTFSNRGKMLEDDIDEANAFYLARGLAVIHKKPVPVQIVKVSYPSRSAAVIQEAYFRTPSTTDYNGVYKGHYIDFDAKETKNKTSFPLQNVHAHQVTHMRAATAQHGVCFLLVCFSTLSRHFILPFHVLDEAWQAMEDGSRKSIPLSVFEERAIEITEGYAPRLDYLKAVDQLLSN
ncbi:Holliday junction resolvase RecU [Kurthia massiliensis]|uniref:Holliday junction resolvase RecU n=1 Tax=Kurthia massiliensis TaxID=1033739 RepID=UPI00028933D9|nr:Holliday junction resolvase RecU [Kurthia massiliensis]